MAEGGRLVLELGAEPLRQLWTDPGGTRHGRLVVGRDCRRQRAGLQRRENGERHLGADALYYLHQPEPVAFDVGQEAIETDRVLADMGLDCQRRCLAGFWQAL